MKLEDIEFIIKDIQREMPKHTENNCKIPYTFSKFPKNLMEESHKKQNKFLNCHLAEIEESIYQKKLPNTIKSWFLHQNFKYHLKSGILNHDGVFRTLKNELLYGHNNHILASHTLFGVIGSSSGGCTGGADVQVDGTDNTTHSSVNNLYCGLISNAEAGKCYNQIAISCSSAAGNKRMANYTDNTGEPDALIAETASIAQTPDYDFVSIPEWTQDGTTNVWCAYNSDSVSNVVNNLSGGQRRFVSTTYGAMPDPFPAPSSDTFPHKQKIGYR